MKTELIDHMGSDLTVVNAARVSFDKESEWEYLENGKPYPEDKFPGVGTIKGGFGPRTYEKNLKEKDERLITYLATHNHWTPFGHPQITLRETVPLFVARERFRHTIGFVYNEVSRRYVTDLPQYYMPRDWRQAPTKDKKQGSGAPFTKEEQTVMDAMYDEHLDCCDRLYNWMIRHGVAPEQARMVLPQSMYTSYYVTGSLTAFARAYHLRSQPDAQKEIQMLASQWDEIIRPLFPVSWEALTHKKE